MLPAFIIKATGALAFALIYVYYYQFGDTFLYFRGASVLGDSLFSDFGSFLKLIFSEGGNLSPELYDYSKSIQYSNASEEWFMIKLLTPLTILSFHSYLVTTLLISTISFIGSWKLFEVLRDIIPRYEKLAFYASFLIPSTLFWGGGIMKDTFTLFGINMLIYCLYYSIYKKRSKWILWVGVVVFSLMIFWLKAYVVLAFIPAVMFGFNALLSRQVGSQFLRYIIATTVLIISVGVLTVLPSILSQYSDKYQVQHLQNRVKGFHTWHSDLGGSAYNLGEVEYTISGVITKIPAALNVTFYRPYLWEARNPVVAIAALESVGFLFLTILAFYRLRFRVFKIIWERPILITFFVYCLIFGFVVGFTSYNFGALGRYKIPIFSLFTFILFYLSIKAEVGWVFRFKNKADQLDKSE